MKLMIVIGANGFVGSIFCAVYVSNEIIAYTAIRSQQSNMERWNAIKVSPYYEHIYGYI